MVRYLLFALAGWTESLPWLWLGIAMHGPCYTFYSVTGQILVNRQVEAGLRNQAQALLSALSIGLGGLVGTLLCGVFYEMTVGIENNWIIYWGSLAVTVLACGLYFCTRYDRRR